MGRESAIRLLFTLSDHSGNSAAQAQIADQLAHLWDAVAPLGRSLLELRVSGCTTAEAARRLGLDSDVTRARLNRLRKRLPAAEPSPNWSDRTSITLRCLVA